MAERKGGRWAGDKQFVVHKDIQEALQNYSPGGDSFKEVFAQRDQYVEDGVIYWNTDHDTEMAETAKERTQRAATKGWRFPSSKKKK